MIIIENASRHSTLLKAANSPVISDAERDEITLQVLEIENQFAHSIPQTNNERFAVIETIALAMEYDGGESAYVCALRAVIPKS